MKSSVVDDTGKTADLMVNQHVSSCYITGGAITILKNMSLSMGRMTSNIETGK
jgi:hypothetical protein